MAAKAAHRWQIKGQWGRLKPVTSDYLEDIGLPSKGDNRHAIPAFALPELGLIARQAARLQGPRAVLRENFRKI